MENIYAELARLLEAGDTVAVATIIDVRGSVPREVGAKMLIHPLGKHVGTVGGGCGEGDVIRTALDVLQTGEPATVHVDLTEDISMQALGVCGGIMDVFVERAAPADLQEPGFAPTPVEAQKPGFLGALRESMANRVPVALATVVLGPKAGRQAVVWLDRAPLGDLGLGEAEAQAIDDARASCAAASTSCSNTATSVCSSRCSAGRPKC